MEVVLLIKCKSKDLLKEIKKVADISQLPNNNSPQVITNTIIDYTI